MRRLTGFGHLAADRLSPVSWTAPSTPRNCGSMRHNLKVSSRD